MTSLKSFRESKNLTQEEVARKADLSNKQYWNIEQGLCDPKLSNLLKISSALNIKVEDLIKLITS